MNLRLKPLIFIWILQLLDACYVATTFYVKINAITQKDGNSKQSSTELVMNYCSALKFNIEKEKDVNRLDIKDKERSDKKEKKNSSKT